MSVKVWGRGSELAQHVEGLATTKPEDQSSIARLHPVDGTDYLTLSSEPPTYVLQAHLYSHTPTKYNECSKE